MTRKRKHESPPPRVCVGQLWQESGLLAIIVAPTAETVPYGGAVWLVSYLGVNDTRLYRWVRYDDSVLVSDV